VRDEWERNRRATTKKASRAPTAAGPRATENPDATTNRGAEARSPSQDTYLESQTAPHKPKNGEARFRRTTWTATNPTRTTRQARHPRKRRTAKRHSDEIAVSPSRHQNQEGLGWEETNPPQRNADWQKLAKKASQFPHGLSPRRRVEWEPARKEGAGDKER